LKVVSEPLRFDFNFDPGGAGGNIESRQSELLVAFAAAVVGISLLLILSIIAQDTVGLGTLGASLV